MAVDKATDVESYLSQNGAVRAKLTAPLMTMMRSDTPKTEFPKSLHVDFYDSVKIQSKLFANYGLYYTTSASFFYATVWWFLICRAIHYVVKNYGGTRTRN
jgi:hypothetical protein